jgi:type II secretory pathway component PulC
MKAIFIKRFWIAEILALGLAAFFVANGVGQMLVDEVEAQLGASAQPTPDPRRAAQRSGSSQRRINADGTPILSRNIFDSVTGPIIRGGGTLDDALSSGIDQEQLATGEYVAVEPCGEKRFKVFTTVAASDPTQSFALLGSGSDQSYYNVGDTLGTQRIHGIGWRYVLLESGRGAGLCYLDLYGLEDTLYLRVEPDEPVSGAAAARAEKPSEPDVPAVADLLSEGERGVSVLDRSVFEKPLDGLAPLIGAVQVVAVSEDHGSGEVDGYSVHGIRRGSLLHEIGLRNGDLIRRVAGIDISDAESALAAYRLAAKSGRVVVELERAGKSRRITLDIR